MPMRAAEGHRAAAEPRGDLVEADACASRTGSGRRMFSSALRQIEVADAAVLHRHGAGDERRLQAAFERRLQRRAAGAADVAEEALQDAEVGVAAHAHGDALVVQVGGAGDLELRCPRRPAASRRCGRCGGRARCGSAPRCAAGSRRAARRGCPRWRRRAGVDVGELADDAHAAARDRGRVGREPRLEGADVGIERRVGDAERQLGVHLGRQRDAAGRRHRQARRRRLELQRHQVAGDADLADAPARCLRRRRRGRAPCRARRSAAGRRCRCRPR